MLKTLELTLCEMQGQLFEDGKAAGFSSEPFIRNFMTSRIAKDLDSDFNHLQWAGKEYILETMTDEMKEELTKDGEQYDKDTLFWIGYAYRFWHFHTGESSKEIYRQAPARVMRANYLAYHTMSVEMAIDRLKEDHQKKKRSGQGD